MAIANRRLVGQIGRVLYETFNCSYLTIIVFLLIGSSLVFLFSFLHLSKNIQNFSDSLFIIGSKTTAKSVTPEMLIIDNNENLEIKLKEPSSNVEKEIPIYNRKEKTQITNTQRISSQQEVFSIPRNSVCPIIPESKADFDSTQVYQTLKFNESGYWDAELEKRYQSESSKFPLKVIIVPHSHTDPGWGWTIEDYYTMWTKNILDGIVTKLNEHKNMTFLWSEVSFLDIWWKSATEINKNLFKKLVKEKRLEITTGGWVMTDESVVHLYSMITQLIEGQEWLKSNIGVLPTAAWSVDPFGFGSVMPYILKNSQIDSMVILRIHYAWKKWLAHKKYGDFRWAQRWNFKNIESDPILCHQHPFFMYRFRESLGPHFYENKKFDFIDPVVEKLSPAKVEDYAKEFILEARRTGSLTEHNVILVILGDDFRFRNITEWDAYHSFMGLFHQINSNPRLYNNSHVEFGTVSTFFDAVRERQKEVSFPTFHGDFFVYSDEISNIDGRGAYWSGFYATRPFWKKLFREAEANVRSAEILFTFARINAGKNCLTKSVSHFLYKRLQLARRHLSLFAHHDGAPGVSDVYVMRDYGFKLNEAIIHSKNVQIYCIKCLLRLNEHGKPLVLTDSETFPRFGLQPFQIPLNFTNNKHELIYFGIEDEVIEKKLVVFNSLTWSKLRAITAVVTIQNVKVIGPNGEIVPSQLNPISGMLMKSQNITISSKKYELVFYYKLAPISITTFRIISSARNSKGIATKANVYYKKLKPSENHVFEELEINDVKPLEISNKKYKLHFNSSTGMLKSVDLLLENEKIQLGLKFGGYTSIPKHSGPYLFMPKTEYDDLSKQNPFALAFQQPTLILITGPLESKLEIITPVFRQTIKLQTLELTNVTGIIDNAIDDNAIFIRNNIFTDKAEGEYFMRFESDLKNNGTIYTDQSGFTFEKRKRVQSIGLEGNYYPITTLGYIHDLERKLRMSLIVDRAHGISSWIDGRMEIMTERRVLYDDLRGINQGVTDNLPTESNYIVTIEKLLQLNNSDSQETFESMLPTLHVHHLSQQLNYPLQTYFLKNEKYTYKNIVSLFKDYILPTDTHLLTMRTQSVVSNLKSPSSNSLMILQKFGYSCKGKVMSENNLFHSSPYNFFNFPNTNETVSNPAANILNDATEFVTVKKLDITGLREPRENIYNYRPATKNAINIFESKPFQISSFLFSFKNVNA